MEKYREEKKCKVCGQSVIDADPIDPERTRSWMKPDFAGLICAYCGLGKLKLYSHLKTVKELVILLQTNGEKRKAFDNFVEHLIETYKSGKQKVRAEDLKQRIVKENEVEIKAGVKGVWKLYASYDEVHGDPATNGKGHQVKTIKWKDGTKQKCVFVPRTKEDEMEAEWSMSNRTKHEAEVHNGEMLTDNQQLARLMDDLTHEKGKSFSGEAEQHPSASPNAAGNAGKASAEQSVGAQAGRTHDAEGEDESDEEDEEQNPLDAVMDFVQETASVPEKGSKTATIKAKGKAKATVNKSAPPALSKAVRATGPGIPKKKATSVAGEDGKQIVKVLTNQAEKCDTLIEKYETSQRATLLGMDKKIFKEVKNLTEKIEARLALAPRDLRERASKNIKYLDLIVKLVKAYKAVVT